VDGLVVADAVKHALGGSSLATVPRELNRDQVSTYCDY
jgi:hypothetical protein